MIEDLPTRSAPNENDWLVFNKMESLLVECYVMQKYELSLFAFEIKKNIMTKRIIIESAKVSICYKKKKSSGGNLKNVNANMTL